MELKFNLSVSGLERQNCGESAEDTSNLSLSVDDDRTGKFHSHIYDLLGNIVCKDDLYYLENVGCVCLCFVECTVQFSRILYFLIAISSNFAIVQKKNDCLYLYLFEYFTCIPIIFRGPKCKLNQYLRIIILFS